MLDVLEDRIERAQKAGEQAQHDQVRKLLALPVGAAVGQDMASQTLHGTTCFADRTAKNLALPPEENPCPSSI
jgi:hypothetical protein